MKREELGERKKFAQIGGWSLPDRVRSALAHIPVLLGYLGLTGLFTYPLYFRFGGEIIGRGDLLDVWQSYWNLWWVKTALLDLFTNPFRTSLLYHPFGASLYFHTLNLSNCLLSLPFRLLFGPIAAYNSIVVLSFVLAGYFTFLLIDYLVSNKPIAFVSGMIFTFCPFHLWHTTGRLQLVALQWLPLYILLLLKAVWEKSDGKAVGAGLALLATSLTDWYYTFYLLLFTAMVLAHEIWKERSLQRMVGLLRPMGITGGVFLILALPVLVPMMKELSLETYQVPTPVDTLFYTPDLFSFFVPSKYHFLWGDHAAGLRSNFPLGHNENFIGYTVLALACLSLVDISLRRKAKLWLFAALLFFVLALGPLLQINGQRKFTDFGLRIPLPYVILYQFMPFVKISRYPNRLSIMTMLSLAVLVAFGMRSLSSKMGKGRPARPLKGQLLPLLAGTLVAIEFLTIPFPLTKLPSVDPFYSTLSPSSIEYGVLDIPVAEPGWRSARYMFYQTLHRLPIFDGYLSRHYPYPLYDIPGFRRYMVDDEEGVVDIVQQGMSDPELFQLFGFRYVVIHNDLMEEKARARIAEEVNAALGDLAPVYQSETVIVYELPQLEEPLVIAMVSRRDNWLPLKQEGQTPFRWMASPAVVRIYASSPVEVRLSLAIRDVAQESAKLLIYSGEGLIDSLAVQGGVAVVTSAIALSEGENLIRLVCPQGNVTLLGVGARPDRAREACLALSQITLSLLPPE